MADYIKDSYDEISPFTKNASVLVEIVDDPRQYLKICMDTGYMTNKLLEEDLFQYTLEALEVDGIFSKIALGYKKLDGGNYWIPFSYVTPEVIIVPTGGTSYYKIIPFIKEDILDKNEYITDLAKYAESLDDFLKSLKHYTIVEITNFLEVFEAIYE